LSPSARERLPVTGLEGDLVIGRVDTEPVDVRTVRCGSRVRIPRRKLNDWLYADGETIHGGFTVKALGQIPGEER
jgi:uncharacterized protein YegJ (DUF2314 family)